MLSTDKVHCSRAHRLSYLLEGMGQAHTLSRPEKPDITLGPTTAAKSQLYTIHSIITRHLGRNLGE